MQTQNSKAHLPLSFVSIFGITRKKIPKHAANSGTNRNIKTKKKKDNTPSEKSDSHTHLASELSWFSSAAIKTNVTHGESTNNMSCGLRWYFQYWP